MLWFRQGQFFGFDRRTYYDCMIYTSFCVPGVLFTSQNQVCLFWDDGLVLGSVGVSAGASAGALAGRLDCLFVF